MATANLKNIYGGGGSSFTLKAGQSFNTSLGVGGVISGSIDVSSPTNIISLTGRWLVTYIEIVCSNPGAGTMTATLAVDGVNVLGSASVGTAQWIPLHGMQFSLGGGLSIAQSPPLLCNNSLILTLQRSTADAVQVRYIALAVD